MRNQTTYITKFSKKEREGDGQRGRRRKKERKEEAEEEEAVASWLHPCFVVVFPFLLFCVFILFYFIFFKVQIQWVASWRHPFFVIVFFLFSFSVFFFFFLVQIRWEAGNRENRSDHGSQNRVVRPRFARVPVFSHRTVLKAKRTAKINSSRFFRSDRTVRSGFQNLVNHPRNHNQSIPKFEHSNGDH